MQSDNPSLTKSAPFIRPVLLVIAGSLVLAFSAQLAIPLMPVPVTFQTMALLLLAVFLGPQLSCFAALTYLLEGALGFPVFSQLKGGLPILFGMTSGYLLALPAAAYIAGHIADKQSVLRIVLAGVASSALVLTSGAFFLSKIIGLKLALSLGFTPFILIEAVKIGAVALGVALSNHLLLKESD